MLHDIMINVRIESPSGDRAFTQLWDFLKYSMNHCGKDYGIIDWEEVEFVTENNSDDDDDDSYSLGV